MKNLKHYTFIIISLVLSFASCSKEAPIGNGLPPLDQTTIWSGANITFTKPANTDPTLASNQDRITSKIWITRANTGGQIYNAVSETTADKNTSPKGTLWAKGSTTNLQSLTFDTFRATVDRPQQVVGQSLVLLLVEENIAMDVTFTQWTSGATGGFAYERSTN